MWVLNRAVFRPIYRMFSSPLELDLFASALNFRLPKYCSRCPDALAWNIDALSFPWRVFDFTRFSLLSSPQDLGQVSPGRSRPSPGSFVLASEVLVSSSPEALGGPSEDVASPERLGGTTHVFDSASQG